MSNSLDLLNTNNIQSGKIVVNSDEWTLSNNGFAQAPDTATFVTNIAKWFTGGRSTGKFHAYSTNFGLTESVLAQTMAKAGYTWTVGNNIKIDLPTLLTFDGIFLCGDLADNQVLIDYVKAGGNVYLGAGTGAGGPQQEADRWNTFLGVFGFKFLGEYNGISGNQTINNTHPIFAGVKAIYLNNGNSIVDLEPASSANQVVLTHTNGQGLIATFASSKKTNKLQCVLSFDGKDDYVALSAANTDYSQGFTVEAWARYSSFQQSWSRIIDFGNGAGQNSIILGHVGTSNALGFHLYSSAGTYSIEAANALEIGKWMHLVATIDKSGLAKLYKDGQLIQSKPFHLPDNVNRTLNFIAKSNWPNDGYFEGQMADVRVWNIARSQEEIQKRMSSRLIGNESGLVSYWPLNDCSGITVADKTGKGNNGTINGAIWKQEELPLTSEPEITSNKASILQFDGKDDYVEIPYSQSLNPNLFTVSGWVKVAGGQGSFRSVITSRDLFKGYIIYAGDNNKWQTWVGNGSAWEVVNNNDIPVVLNVWTHVASTFDGKQLKLYINGTEVSSKNVGYTLNTRYPLRIGAGFTEAKPQYFFSGQIAEVSVWNKALTGAEIQAKMNQRLTGKEEGLVAYLPLNEGSGNLVTDQKGNGNKGTINGAIWQQEELPFKLEPAKVSQPVVKNIQSVLMFDGIDDNLTLPKGFPTIEKAITIEFWAKGENSLSQQTSVIEAHNAQNTRVLNVHFPWKHVVNSRIFWDAGNENGYNRIDKEVKLEEYNVWTHWAFVKDVSTGKMFTYRNGEIWHQGEGNTKTLSGIQKFVIGSFVNGGNYWKGYLTELRIWNAARTPEEIKQNMNFRLTGDEAGLVGYYPLNEDSDDKTGNGNNGIIKGAIWQQEELPIESAISDRIEINLITGGNTLTKYGISDGATNFYLVDTNNAVNGNGELTEWEICSEKTLPVQLIIYRKEANVWSVVGKSEIQTPVVGLNHFSLSTPLKVNNGDFVGLYHPQAGSVSFFLAANSPSSLGNLSGTVLYTASGAAPTAFSNSTNRIYSLKVKGNLVSFPSQEQTTQVIPEDDETQILWQIGYPGQIGKESSQPGGWKKEVNYVVGSDGDPVNNSKMPFLLLKPGLKKKPKLNGKSLASTDKLNIRFMLERNYDEGELILGYDFFGSETDTLSLDGNNLTNIVGAGEGILKQNQIPLGALDQGEHTLTITTDGGDGFHWIDYLRLLFKNGSQQHPEIEATDDEELTDDEEPTPPTSYTFQLVAVKVPNGQYLVAENGGGGSLLANSSQISPWETFRLITLENGKFALKAPLEEVYLSIHPDGNFTWVDDIQEWEMLELIELGDNKVAFKGCHGKYISIQQGGGGIILANGLGINEWEILELIDVESGKSKQKDKKDQKDKKGKEIKSQKGKRKRKRANTIILEFGRQKKDDIRDFTQGRGRLFRKVAQTISALKDVGEIDSYVQPLIVIISPKKSRKRRLFD